MTLRLRVAASLDPLVDELAAILARPLDDPFTPEVVAVPGDGVRAWLQQRLAERLGDDGDGRGIVANVEFVYPAQIVERALGRGDTASPWSVGSLTFVVHDLLAEHGADLGQVPSLARARAIADLFDRYTLHRPAMVVGWSAGRDVDAAGQALAASAQWQPRLWRLVRDRLGGISAAEEVGRAALDLAAGRLDPALPARVSLFGLASLPGPHLRVLAALAQHRDVHVLAPVPSLTVWERLRSVAPEPLALPLDRRDDPSAGIGRHGLLATWGRAAREAHLLLLDATRETPADVAAVVPAHPGRQGHGPETLLRRIQVDLATDSPPSGSTVALDPADRSVEWHRCHGPARQVEVLRDVVLHLLQEREPDGTPRFEPRDIAVLCPDVPAVAPFAVAAFAGDPANGIPTVPLRVADRSLRSDNALLDAVGSLVQLIGARATATEVLAFASLPPVRRCFGLDTDRLERIGTWARATNVRWGLDVDHRRGYGLPETVAAHTWRSALDQLLVGAAMADAGPRLGPGGVVPFGDVEGADVETAGALAEMIDRLGAALAALGASGDVVTWTDALARAARDLFAVSDDDGFQWRDLDTLLTGVREDAQTAASNRSIPGEEVAALVLERLAGRSGRPRFGTGAVTLSSLTAQRGVPHRVVCLVGLDGDLGGSGVAQADDLSATPACVGDRDPRSELRAQMLDAVLAAEDRLVLVSTGRNVRTNAEVAPAVVLAELLDLVDASAAPVAGRRPSAALSVDHPRQAWSIRTVERDALRPGHWSFDRGVLTSLRAADGVTVPTEVLLAPEPEFTRITLADLVGVARNPVSALLHGRLGIWLDRDPETPEDLIPVDVTGLDLWRVCEDLLRARLDAAWDEARRDDWTAVQRARGAIPPLDLGRTALRTAADRVDALLGVRDLALTGDGLPLTSTRSIDVGVTVDGVERRVTGEIADVWGSTAVSVSASRLRNVHHLETWITAAALAVETGGPARAVAVGRNDSKRASDPEAIGLVVEVASAEAGLDALRLWVDVLLRARRCVVPALPDTCRALHLGDEDHAHDAWTGKAIPGLGPQGDSRDPWVSFVLPGLSYDEVRAALVLPGEVGEDWPQLPHRLACWAERIWGGFASLATTGIIAEGGA